MAWHNISLVVEGALDCEWSSVHSAISDPDEFAAKRAREMEGSEFASWEIFITPHDCDPYSDRECVCVQYFQDHKPAFSGGRADPQ